VPSPVEAAVVAGSLLPGLRRAKRSAAPRSAAEVVALARALPALRAEIDVLIERAELLLGTVDELDRVFARAELRSRRFDASGAYV
jgi:hypothetical protein